MYQKIKDYLNSCIKNNLLSHAYIFYGPDKIAKMEMAFWFANNILASQKAWHPDLFSFNPEPSSEIGVDLIRQMKKFLSLSPYSADYKIAIIENAENLNNYAQNAILKIFEEAPAHAIIILCVKTLDSIEETIISRGIKLPFWHSAIQKEKKFFDIFEKIFKNSGLILFSDFENFSNYKTPAVFESWLNFLRTKFILNPNKNLLNLLKTSQNIYFKLNETNINQKFAYDELLLNLQLATNDK